MRERYHRKYRLYLAFAVCSHLSVYGCGMHTSAAADIQAHDLQSGSSSTTPIRLADAYVRPDYVEIEKLRDTKQVIVITRRAIEEKGYKTVSDVLQDQPSIHVGATGWGQVDIRGQGSDQATRNIQVLIDGAPVTTMVNHPLPNNYDYVPVEQIEKIEIIPGGGSVIYGSGAAGGIINITTNLRSMRTAQRSVATEWNSDGYRLDLNYGDNLGEKLTLQAGYTHLARDLYFVDTYRNSDYAYAGLRYDADADHSITFRYSRLDETSTFLQNVLRSNVERYGRDYRPADRKDYLNGDRKLDAYNLTYNQNLGQRWKFSGDFFYTNGWYKNTKFFDGKMDTNTHGTRMKFDYAYGEKDALLIGIDWIKQESDLKYKASERGKRMHFQYEKETQALYLLHQMRRGKFTFTQGIRRDDTIWSFAKDGGTTARPIGGQDTSHRWNTAGEVSIAYQYGPVGRVYARWERGFTNPDGLQISDEVAASRTRKVYQASAAQEEHYDLYELGVRDKIGATAIQLTLFSSVTKNELNRPLLRGPNGIEYKTFNMYHTKRRGIDLTLQQRLGKLDLREGYAYLHGTRDYTAEGRSVLARYGADAIDFTNSGLKSVPKHKAIFQADYTFDKQWSMGLKYTYFGSYNNFIKASDRHTSGSTIDSYGLLDLHFKFKQNRDMEWYGGITNVLGKTYFEYAGDGMGTLIPGFPRTYFIGARYTF